VFAIQHGLGRLGKELGGEKGDDDSEAAHG
jgi:hypothetical protein